MPMRFSPPIVLVLLAFSPVAEAQIIYWTDWDTGRISRANMLMDLPWRK